MKLHQLYSFSLIYNNLRISLLVLFLVGVTEQITASGFIECHHSTDELLSKEELEGMLVNNVFVVEIDSFYHEMNLLYCSALHHGNTKVQAHAINQIAFYYYCRAEYSTALELLLRGHNHSTQTNYVHGLVDYHCYMGLISQDIGNTENALDHYRTMLKIAEKTDNRRWLADAHINIGSIYIIEGQLDDAEQYLTTAIDILEGGELTESDGWANSHLGTIYSTRGDTTKALQFYNTSIDIWTMHQSLRGLAFVYNNLGVMMKDKDFDASVAYHKQALQYAIDSDFKAQQLISKLKLGKIYTDVQIDSSFYYLNDILRSDSFSTSLFVRERASRYLMEVTADLEQDSLHQAYLKINHATVTELLEFQKEEHRNWLRLEREIHNLEQDSYRQTLAHERSAILYRQLLLGFILVTCMALILVWYVYKYLQASKQTKEANSRLNENIELLKTQSEVLAAQNKALDKQKTTLNGQLANKLDMVREIHLKNDQLKEAIFNMEIGKENQRRLTRLIDNDTNTELLQHLDDELEQVHSSLFAKLVRQHPKLTGNNLRLISYIKMHLSNKEIADLLYISPGSVKVAKNRLKKKLELGSSESIDFYIHSLDARQEQA